MGALLSLPLLMLPSAATLWSIGASCCGAATCSALCNSCGKFRSSMATRIAYALILLVNSILAWIMLTPWAIHKLEHLTLDYMTFECGSNKQCYGFFAVQRINFALGLFHFLLAVILLGVRSSKDGRAGLQNGYWGPKIIVWVAFIVISFLIPEGFFQVWGNYIALGGAMLFVLLGLVLLVDLAHTWVELCMDKFHDESNPNGNIWRGTLIGSAIAMYIGSITMTILMYIYFAGSGCSMNITAITVNLIAILVATFISVQPSIQDINPRAGIGQAAMVCVYCTYLTFSAVCMEPDDRNCNPLIRARGARTSTTILGAIVTMLTIAYTTTRAATQGFVIGNPNASNAYVQLSADDESYAHSEHDLVTTQPRTRRQMALEAAIAEGSLPASATLDSDSDDSSDSDSDRRSSKKKSRSRDDERRGTQYNYSLFHVIFLLATCWVATLLTQSINSDDDQGPTSDFAPVGRSYWNSWIKIVSAWICYAIYTWSLVAPLVLPNREFA